MQDDCAELFKPKIGISYVLRATNGLMKLGFTAKGLDGLHGRFRTHQQDERRRGRGAPEFLCAFESSRAFDTNFILKLRPFRADFSSEWFHPEERVICIFDRLLQDVRAGRDPTIPPKRTPEEVEKAAREYRAFTLVYTFFPDLAIGTGYGKSVLGFGGIEAVLALERQFQAELAAIGAVAAEIDNKQETLRHLKIAMRDRLSEAFSLTPEGRDGMIPPSNLQACVSKLIADRGVEDTAKMLGLTEETTFRIAHGNAVRPVSINSALALLKLNAQR